MAMVLKRALIKSRVSGFLKAICAHVQLMVRCCQRYACCIICTVRWL